MKRWKVINQEKSHCTTICDSRDQSNQYRRQYPVDAPPTPRGSRNRP